MSNGCNGWANWATWNFMLHESENLEAMLDDLIEVEIPDYGSIHTMLEGYADVLLEELDMPVSFASDAAGQAFAQVDFHEITRTLIESLQDKLTAAHFEDYVLEDDGKETGGTSFDGETVNDFVEEIGEDLDMSLRDLNRHLVACGIEVITID